MLSSAFTDWHPKPMREVVEFCKENDPYPPDPIPQMVIDGLIRQQCAQLTREQLNANEQQKYETWMQAYYEAQWSSVIMAIMRYRNPLVANAHTLTTLSAKVDPNHKMFFHIDWVKPGKHMFVVEHDKESIILDTKAEDF